MRSFLRTFLIILLVGTCCKSGSSSGSDSVAKQGQLVAYPRNPFRPQSRPVISFVPVIDPRYIRPAYVPPPVRIRPASNRPSQSTGTQLALILLLKKILNNRNNNDDDTGGDSNVPEPANDCEWGEWGSCSISTTSCGTRRRTKKCNGEIEVQAEACNVPTGFRDIDGEQWYLAANCYEYYISDSGDRRLRSSALSACQGRNGAILASKGFRIEDIRTDVMSELRNRIGSSVVAWVGVRRPSPGNYEWDDGDTTTPTFFGVAPIIGFGTCHSMIIGNSFSLRRIPCSSSFRYICERAATT